MRLDAFGKLIDDIDGMVKDLKKQSADMVKQKDYCNDALHKNDMAQDAKSPRPGESLPQLQNSGAQMATCGAHSPDPRLAKEAPWA